MIESGQSSVLLIGYVWPEPWSSAAGIRQWNLIRIFERAGWRIHFSSPSKTNEARKEIETAGIATSEIPANDPRFDELLKEFRPDVVVFDRFIIEEQFGWRVAEVCPDALRVVDTQDLHSLRRAREAAISKGAPLEDVFEARVELHTEDSLREIASIYRSDLSWVLSDFEQKLLLERFQVPSDLLSVSRFCYAQEAREPGYVFRRHDLDGPAASEFGAREHFVMIGNFRHAPNADAVLWLKNEIWPRIRAKLPEAQVHIYGAYPPKEMMKLESVKDGFLMKGHADDSVETLARYRVNLAPLRFGAGIKGKIADGWAAGTPVVTTPIGAEGMGFLGTAEWGGLVGSSVLEVSELACKLYLDREVWTRAAERGTRIFEDLFSFEKNSEKLLGDVDQARLKMRSRRRDNFVGAMLNHHLHKSTQYFSRWIELKNRSK